MKYVKMNYRNSEVFWK